MPMITRRAMVSRVIVYRCAQTRALTSRRWHPSAGPFEPVPRARGGLARCKSGVPSGASVGLNASDRLPRSHRLGAMRSACRRPSRFSSPFRSSAAAVTAARALCDPDPDHGAVDERTLIAPLSDCQWLVETARHCLRELADVEMKKFVGVGKIHGCRRPG